MSSQRRFALARTIVCCGASIVAHFARKVSYSASPQASAKSPRGAPCSDAIFAMLFASKTRRNFSVF